MSPPVPPRCTAYAYRSRLIVWTGSRVRDPHLPCQERACCRAHRCPRFRSCRHACEQKRSHLRVCGRTLLARREAPGDRRRRSQEMCDRGTLATVPVPATPPPTSSGRSDACTCRSRRALRCSAVATDTCTWTISTAHPNSRASCMRWMRLSTLAPVPSHTMHVSEASRSAAWNCSSMMCLPVSQRAHSFLGQVPFLKASQE